MNKSHLYAAMILCLSVCLSVRPSVITHKSEVYQNDQPKVSSREPSDAKELGKMPVWSLSSSSEAGRSTIRRLVDAGDSSHSSAPTGTPNIHHLTNKQLAVYLDNFYKM